MSTWDSILSFTKKNVHNILHVVFGGTLAILGLNKLLSYLPSPEKFMKFAFGYRNTMLMKAAVELKVFIKMKELIDNNTPTTVLNIAKVCGTSEKGMRILLDSLYVNGFIKKHSGKEATYTLTFDSTIFLSNEESSAYFGNTIEFLCSSK